MGGGGGGGGGYFDLGIVYFFGFSCADLEIQLLFYFLRNKYTLVLQTFHKVFACDMKFAYFRVVRYRM